MLLSYLILVLLSQCACRASNEYQSVSTVMPPRPHRLEPLNGASHGRVPDRHKEMLFAKYGDLTSTGLVAPQIRDAAGLLGRQSELTAAAAAARGNGGGSQDDAPYVTRREFEDRLAQMEQRIALLASALRQQDDLTTRNERESVFYRACSSSRQQAAGEAN